MSKINYQALREAAEQAMHDDWDLMRTFSMSW
ncbi:ead/Ea22-like family protein [Escherichia coli]